ncbi:hypothetical protein P7H06_04325 [Paenibacillus larvae]|nr:hypothetical protein [Paenibacillus larvae]MDT2258942.1 hypothetical protein [Paenibacillus larvae]
MTPRLQVKTKDEVGQISEDMNQMLGAMSQIIDKSIKPQNKLPLLRRN